MTAKLVGFAIYLCKSCTIECHNKTSHMIDLHVHSHADDIVRDIDLDHIH